MSDDRSERLRNKRRSVKERASESGPSEPSQADKQEQSDKSDETGGSVKEDHVGVMMYLPEEQASEVSYQFDRLKAEYKRETGEELEKNRHFRPLLIKHGLDSLEGWDGVDVKEALDRITG